MKIFAHASTIMLGKAPQESFENALSSRADAIEVDVRRCVDGLICYDEATFKGWPIGEAGKKWLLDSGGLDIRGVMDLAKRSDKTILFDIKPADGNLPASIIDMAEASGIPSSRIILGVRDLPQAMQAYQTDSQAGILGFFPFEKLQAYAAIVGPDQYFRLWELDSTPEKITAVQDAGLFPITMTG